MNGTPPGSSGDSDGDRNREWAFRTSLRRPPKAKGPEWALGLALTLSHEHQSPLPTLRSPMKTVFLAPNTQDSCSGRRWRLCPQASWSQGPLFIQAEYIWMHQNRSEKRAPLCHRSWLCTWSFSIRGGHRDSGGYHCSSQTWGLEWTARIHGVELDAHTLDRLAYGSPRLSCVESGLLFHPHENIHWGLNLSFTRHTDPVNRLIQKETGLRFHFLAQF